MSTDASADRPAAPRRGRSGRGHAGRLLALAATAATTLAVMLAGPAAPAFADEPLVNGGGSSYAAVALNQWASETHVQLGLNVNYAVSSSVQGLNEFALNQLNFAASEIGYSTEQADYNAKPGYQYLPDVAGATCLDYHLTAVNGKPITELLLDSQIMADVFTGQIKYWDAPAIKALNPGVLLPHQSIVVVWREDPSGDNYLFSQYLNAVQPTIWQPFDRDLGYYAHSNYATAIWPSPSGQNIPKQYNFSGWVGENGSDNAAYYVASTPGAITYVETAYAKEYGDPCAYIRNESGHYVIPSAYNDAVALTKATLLPDLEQELGGVYTNPDPAAYPISAYSYLITWEKGYSPQLANELGRFIVYFACEGQATAESLGYSPLPPILVLRDFQAVDRITGASPAPAAPTPQNCADPYVNGTQYFPGGPHVSGSTGGSTPTTVASTGPTTTLAGTGTTTTTVAGSTGPGSSKRGHSHAGGRKSKTGGPKKPTSGVITGPQKASKTSNDGLALYEAATGLTNHSGPAPGRESLVFGLGALALALPGIALGLRQRRRRRAS